jgi:L-histidine N-alpha-methyltransferase
VPFMVDTYLGPDDLDAALRSDALEGLAGHDKELPPKWFYDDLGSKLFDAITDLPEYYPTRCERQILEQRADEIARIAEASTLVELGSGTSAKTRILLDALGAGRRLRRFVPLDVSETTLRLAATSLTALYSDLEVHAVVGDFERHLVKLPGGDRRLVAFLGGTIGNLLPQARGRFYDDLAAVLEPGEMLLLGTDLIKDPARLIAAYDDATGVTAAFNRNVLNVLNGRLGGTFDPRQFTHIARWDADHEWIEMRLQSDVAQQAEIADLPLTVNLEAGETIRTEISTKFVQRRVEDELSRAGLRMHSWWTDDAGDFALSLSVRT